jgi:hypothetical protein
MPSKRGRKLGKHGMQPSFVLEFHMEKDNSHHRFPSQRKKRLQEAFSPIIYKRLP